MYRLIREEGNSPGRLLPLLALREGNIRNIRDSGEVAVPGVVEVLGAVALADAVVEAVVAWADVVLA